MSSDVTAPLAAAIAEAEKLITSAEFIDTDIDLADGLDYLAGSIAAVCARLASMTAAFSCSSSSALMLDELNAMSTASNVNRARV